MQPLIIEPTALCLGYQPAPGSTALWFVAPCVCADLDAQVCDLSDLFIREVCMLNPMCVCISGPKACSLKLKSGFLKCL